MHFPRRLFARTATFQHQIHDRVLVQPRLYCRYANSRVVGDLQIRRAVVLLLPSQRSRLDWEECV